MSLRTSNQLLPALLSVCFGFVAGQAPAAEPVNLKCETEVGEVRIYQIGVETEGKLRLNPDGKKVRELPVEVKANLLYNEKTLELTEEQQRSIRYYRKATADITIDKREIAAKLDEANAVVLDVQGSKVHLFRPETPLTRGELDLIDLPANTLTLMKIAPKEAVELNDTWKIDVETMAQLLRVDAITKSEVEAKFSESKDGVGIITFAGPVSGAVDGVATDIDVDGKINVDTKNHQLRWLVLTLKEKRAIGHAQPGYETSSVIRIAAAPARTPPALEDEVIEKMVVKIDDVRKQLSYHSAFNGFRLQHDRRWRLMVDRADGVVYRMIDNGDLIAQLSINKLDKLPTGKRLSAEGFQQEIQGSLGESFGDFADAAEFKTENGLDGIRVTAVGNASDLAIRWICYHVSDAKGNRASYVFTLEEKFIERFADSDEAITSSFEFVDTATAKKATVETR